MSEYEPASLAQLIQILQQALALADQLKLHLVGAYIQTTIDQVEALL